MKPSAKQKVIVLGLIAALPGSTLMGANAESLRDQAQRAVLRAVGFFSGKVAVQGSYLWQYSEDLSKREGEGKATSTQGWIQPPGTPAVGLALLAAYEATGETRCLDAARETAQALLRGQLRSGGWTYFVDFDPSSRRPLAYRLGGSKSKKARNTSTLDDDTTQAALRFLMNADRVLQFKDASLQDAIRFAMGSLLNAQYPNGAWPQGFDGSRDPSQYPVMHASYPDTWSRTPDIKEYWHLYTLNDNTLVDLIETMFEAERIYRDPDAGAELNRLARACRSAAEKAGDFILLAQMPDPQPAWAQQYNFEMHPSWARKFEPPAISGGESQGILRALVLLYRQTNQRKYLDPIPRALDYFRRSRLPDGRLARFYELRTNRPLYFTKDYQLTYDPRNVPTHYSFTVGDGTEAIAREFEAARQLGGASLPETARPDKPKLTRALAAEVGAIIAAQDAQGRWVENGRLRYHGNADPTTRVIRSATFAHNVETLSRYLLATQP